jgi:hypothetical protein
MSRAVIAVSVVVAGYLALHWLLQNPNPSQSALDQAKQTVVEANRSYHFTVPEEYTSVDCSGEACTDTLKLRLGGGDVKELARDRWSVSKDGSVSRDTRTITRYVRADRIHHCSARYLHVDRTAGSQGSTTMLLGAFIAAERPCHGLGPDE